MNEVKEGLGTIEEKSEAMSKKGEYWRYKIRMDGDEDAKYPTSFSMWDYEAGNKVKVGDYVKVFWEENPGKSHGKDITYRNLKSIGTSDKYEKDPKLGSDEQLGRNAPKESMKEILHKETSGEVGVPTNYSDREERKQLLIVRQSSLNYATQLATVIYTWELNEDKITHKKTFGDMARKIKEIAKEYEEQILRR